jgi:hypothetical protein
MKSLPHSKHRSLEAAVTACCRLHKQMLRRGITLIDLRKRRKLRESLRDLNDQISSHYSNLCRMLNAGDADPVAVIAGLRALKITIAADVGLFKHQRRYLLKALSLAESAKSLDHAFGIARRKRGAPKKSEQDAIEIAAEVLSYCLKGAKLESAAHLVSRKFAIGATQARKYWAEHKIDAIAIVRNKRPADIFPWKLSEKKRLERLIGKNNRALARFLKKEALGLLPVKKNE